MLLETGFPSDERVEKEIKTLQDQGMEVHLACSTRKNEAVKETVRGIIVYRMNMSKLWFKLSALILIWPSYLRKWRRFVHGIYKDYQFDVLHVHDLPLSKVAYQFKENSNIKMVCDQHEFYSNWIVDTAHYNTFQGKIVKGLSNWKRYEKKMLSSADLVITVAEPLREQYLKTYSLDPQKIVTLPNTPSKKVFSQKNVDVSLFSQYEAYFSVLYFGGLDILRGLDNVIRAIPLINKHVPNFKLLLAGPSYGGYDPLKTAHSEGVEEYVDFMGWINLDQIPSLISVSQVGIFTPPSGRTEINKTIATKNYQFLVMQKPMIVGRAKYMKEFSEANQIGISVNEDDPEDIAKGIIKMAEDEDFRKMLIANCREIGGNYYWESTSKSLISGYAELNKR